VTPEEVAEIERHVNEQIRLNTPVVTEERSTQEAMAAGAMALFGEKYGDRVRVVSIPGFSMELCGGTHCRATGDIGFFTIVSEGGVAAGVRRIEALTGAGAVASHQAMRTSLNEVLAALGTTAERARETIENLQAETKRLQRDRTKQQISAIKGLKDAYETVDIQGVKLVRTKVTGLEKDALRGLVDSLRGEIKSGVVVVGSIVDNRVQIVAGVTPDLTDRISAGLLIKALAPIVGGKGGGRADFAEAGGKEPAKMEQMLQESSDVLAGLIAAAPPSTKR
jgi:alanyl-tRNA synthetase